MVKGQIEPAGESFFRHIVKTVENGVITEHPFRNRIVAQQFREKAEAAGTYYGYEMRTVNFDKLPWRGNVREA